MTDALDKMIAAVEAGNLLPDDIHESPIPFQSESDVWRAYKGSLDAANALHAALLPGWRFCLGINWARIWPEAETYHSTGAYDMHNADPARAWLLAILRAYRGMQA